MRVDVLQTCPLGHCVPVPQEGPPGHTLAMFCPHATCAGDWLHRGAHTHAPALQTCPEGHRVPVPAQVCPGHTLGIVAPQVTVLADGQLGTHSHMRVLELQR